MADIARKASAHWEGDLKSGNGTVSTESGVLAGAQYSFSTRFENGQGTNPEELFAAGYAACFLGAMKAAAAQGGPKVPSDASVTSTVGIGPRSEGGFGIDVALDISLPGLERAEAEALVEKAHQICPYSNATRNNVPVRLRVV